jgi:hypothetical protein
MTFLNPLLLFGTAAVLSPILIHLLMNRKVKVVTWAAMRFLLESVQKNKKQMNMEDILLLILRCVLLALAALALARPAFKSVDGGALASGPETAVIILDHSYSMSRTDGSQSLFDKARKAADDAIDALPTGSQVAVLLASDSVDALLREPTHDLNLARKLVRDASLSDGGTNLLPAVHAAVGMLSKAESRPSLTIITDGQASGLSNLDGLRAALGEIQGVETQLVLLGEPGTSNLGVSAIRLGSAFAVAGQAVRVEADITNYGLSPAADVQVVLAQDEEPPSAQAAIAEIPAGETRSVSLQARFDKPGTHLVRIQLPADRLPADDSRALALRVYERIDLLVVSGKTIGEPRDLPTFYLENALAPVAPHEREAYPLRFHTIRPDEFNAGALAGKTAVILVDVPELPAAGLEELQRYVQGGGSLWVFAGGNAKQSFYNDVLFRDLGLLPAELGPVVTSEIKPEFAPPEYRHPITGIWNNPAAGTLVSSRIQRAWELKLRGASGDEARPGIAVLHYTSGAPAIAEGGRGNGRVMLFGFSPHTADLDLPLRPAFVPLIQRSLGWLMEGSDSSMNVDVGGMVALKVPADFLGREVTVHTPQGETHSVEIVMQGAAAEFQFRETARMGGYLARGEGNPVLELRFAVQADPQESRVEEASPEALAVLGGDKVELGSGDSLGEQVRSRRTAAEFWRPLLIAVLLIAAVESILSRVFSRSK